MLPRRGKIRSAVRIHKQSNLRLTLFCTAVQFITKFFTPPLGLDQLFTVPRVVDRRFPSED
jgi:hypothetical protein